MEHLLGIRNDDEKCGTLSDEEGSNGGGRELRRAGGGGGAAEEKRNGGSAVKRGGRGASQPGARRFPSPSIDNAPPPTSTRRTSSASSSSTSMSDKALCRNLISKAKADLHPRQPLRTSKALPITAEANVRSTTRPAPHLAKLCDGPTSPSLREKYQKEKTTSFRSLDTLSGVSASRRHSLSANVSQRIPSTPKRRASDPKFLQQLDSKAGEDVRLDFRGQNIWRLDQIAVHLTSKLEFVYLRGNKLSSFDGLEALRGVKVLDLSFNEFIGGGFDAIINCKALQQLYLAGNQITSLSTFPQLPNLEFLSVTQNKLTSLTMSSQPRLQVLAASSNKIMTFKGFPHLPMLEHLRLEDNPIFSIPHVEAASILVVGETLKRFNNRDLSIEEQKLALAYPAHTALCLREGWNFCGIEEAFDSTLHFLVAQWRDRLPPGLSVKKAAIDSPSEEDCCLCCFIIEKESGTQEDTDVFLTYQWFLGDKTASNFSPIEGATTKTYWPKHQDIGRCLKVECKPVIEGTEYPSIFAISAPVTAGTGCPKVLSLRVNGEFIEGHSVQACAEVAWCGGTPGKAIVSWLRRYGNDSPVAIMGAEDDQYMLTVDDVSANLLLMYTPVTKEGVRGESQFATTASIQAAEPCVKNVVIIGPLIEGATVKGAGKYFGGREGKSTFQWLREDPYSGKFKLVALGEEYLLSKEDVGLRMMFTYTPRNMEGIEGNPMSMITNKVLVAPPKVTHIKILGHIRESNIVSVSASVVGGTEDASRVQWFKTSSSQTSLEDVSLEPISSSKIAKDFRVPVGAVGYYLAAKFVPGCVDGDRGEPVLIVSEQVVEMLPPSLTFLSVNGEVKEGETLTASYGYIGGHEGRSEYSWYLHENDSELGVPIASASGLLQYKVTLDAVGKLLSFRCTPVREDGAVGETRSTMIQDYVQPGLPTSVLLKITGDPIEGAVLYVDKKYSGGFEGPSKIQWYLKRANTQYSEIPDANFASYKVKKDDINCLIRVSYEPVRADGVKGATAVSEEMGPIGPGIPACESLTVVGEPIEGGMLSYEAVYTGGEMGLCRAEWYRRSSSGEDDRLSHNETLDLTSIDVGCCILLRFVPVRKDGLTGAPSQTLSEIVKNADPVGVSLSIPECCEGVEIIPKKSYYGGSEGHSEFKWFRVPCSTLEATLPEDAVPLTNSFTYTPTGNDVGMHIALSWTPVRSDGKAGRAIITCSTNSVLPAFPSVKNVTIKRTSAQEFAGQGDYSGGVEGNSKPIWLRESEDGTLVLIERAETKTYRIVEEDYSHRLVFGYTPVRQDGLTGETVLSEKSALILPDVSQPLKLLLSGKAVESELLNSTGLLFENEADQVAWQKYKKEIKYQWLRSSTQGVSTLFETLPLQRTSSYKVRSEDVGYVLRCECTMTDIFGRSMEPVAAMTSPVLPGTPKLEKVEIAGRGYHTNPYAVRGIYSGGREGKSMIQWFRAVSGRPDLIPIIGEVGRMYEANVDDIGCRLVAVYTPVREDGVGGAPVSASTEVIAIEPEVAREVKQKLELGAVKFEALRDRELPTMKGLGSLERRILDVNKKRFKVVKPGSKTSFPNTEIRGTYAPPFHVDIIQNDQHRLKIVVDNENEVDLMVQTRHMRDVIVLVLRGFALRCNAGGVPPLLKP